MGRTLVHLSDLGLEVRLPEGSEAVLGREMTATSSALKLNLLTILFVILVNSVPAVWRCRDRILMVMATRLGLGPAPRILPEEDGDYLPRAEPASLESDTPATTTLAGSTGHRSESA